MKQSDLKTLCNAVKNLYDYGCYFMDLLYVSFNREPTLEEMLDYYAKYLRNGWIDEECFVKQPALILKDLLHQNFRVEKSSDFSSKARFVIGYWFNVRTGYHHFVVMKDKNTVKWDSIQNSKTVSEGVIESYRNIYII